MDKREFGLFVSALRTYYSKENLLPNQQAVELWYRQLQDVPYPVACAVLDKWVATNKWSPSIADIREAVAEIQSGGAAPDWGEGWKQALNAIRRFGMYNETEAMESLPPLTRETVQRLGYRELCLSENQMADRANFRQIYETITKRQMESKRVPLPVRESIASLTAGFAALSEKQEHTEASFNRARNDAVKKLLSKEFSGEF